MSLFITTLASSNDRGSIGAPFLNIEKLRLDPGAINHAPLVPASPPLYQRSCHLLTISPIWTTLLLIYV